MWFLLKLFTLVASSLLLHNACKDNYFYNRFLLLQASVGELTQSVTNLVEYENESQPLHYDFQIVAKPPVITSSLLSARNYVILSNQTNDDKSCRTVKRRATDNNQLTTQSHVLPPAAIGKQITVVNRHFILNFKPNMNTAMLIYKPVKRYISTAVRQSITHNKYVNSAVSNERIDTAVAVYEVNISKFVSKFTVETPLAIEQPIHKTDAETPLVIEQPIHQTAVEKSLVIDQIIHQRTNVETSLVIEQSNWIQSDAETRVVNENPSIQSDAETRVVNEQPNIQSDVETRVVIEQPSIQSDVETTVINEQPSIQSDEETRVINEQPSIQSDAETRVVNEQPSIQSDAETHVVNEKPNIQSDEETRVVNEQPSIQSDVETTVVNQQPSIQSDAETRVVNDQPSIQSDEETVLGNGQPSIQSDEEATLVNEQPSIQPDEEATLVNEQPSIQPDEEATLVNEQTSIQSDEETTLVNGQPSIQPDEEATLVNEQPSIQPDIEATLVNEQPSIQPDIEATLVNEQPSIQPDIEATLVNEQPSIQPDIEATLVNEQPSIQSDIEATLVNEQPIIQPDIEATVVNGQHVYQTTRDTGLSRTFSNQEHTVISLSKEYADNEDIHKKMKNDEERTCCLHDQLKFYLPSYIYNELIYEYHLINQDYEQRQLNDSTKAIWKQILNIYLRKIKLFTRQVNSLLWKLTSHVSNYIKQTAETFIKNFFEVAAGCICCFYVTLKVALKSMDIKFRDGFYLAAFLLAVNEMKKSHKNQLDVLSKYYDKETENLQSLLNEQTVEQQQQMKETREQSDKDRIRSGQVMLEQTKKIETLLDKLNRQPFFPPPPPPPQYFYTQNIPPFQRPKIKLTPPLNVMSNTRPTLPTDQSLRPTLNRPSAEKVDSLQFFGCPDNYIRPAGLKLF